MSIETNPFWIDGPVPPSRFIGRRREVRKTFSQLTGPGQGSVAISGPCSTGKTSLLCYLAAPEIAAEWGLTEDNALISFLDCQLVDHPFNITDFWQQVLTLLQPHLGNADFEVVLDALHQGGQRLILLLDNFEWLIRTQVANETMTRDFLSQLRALINRRPRALSLVVATGEPLEELCQTIDFGGASPFPNSFMSIRLKEFTDQEINELIEHTLSGTGVTFDERDCSHVCQLSQGHPLLAQLAGHLIFAARASGLLTVESYQAMEARFVEEAKMRGLSF